jgi:hypothetical protein
MSKDVVEDTTITHTHTHKEFLPKEQWYEKYLITSPPMTRALHAVPCNS